MLVGVVALPLLVAFSPAGPAVRPHAAAIARRVAASPLAALTTSEELIPRDVLFGNPEYAAPSLSPDGRLLSYLRPDPESGVLNVWCRTVGGTDDRVVTSDKYRGIRQSFCASAALEPKTLSPLLCASPAPMP